jgi:hypothetical protein
MKRFPRLSPPDFDLFPILKKPLRRKRFGSIEEVFNEVTWVIRRINSEGVQTGIQNFPKPWTAVIKRYGGYWRPVNVFCKINSFLKRKHTVCRTFEMTHVHLRWYLADFLLEWQMFQTKFVAKMKTNFMLNNLFSRKLCPLWENVGKYVTARQATESIIRHMCTACWITKAMYINTEYVILIAFLQQQWLHLNVTLHLYCLAFWMLTLLVHTVTTGFKWVNSLQSSFLMCPRM